MKNAMKHTLLIVSSITFVLACSSEPSQKEKQAAPPLDSVEEFVNKFDTYEARNEEKEACKTAQPDPSVIDNADYKKFCSSCHGAEGAGSSTIVGITNVEEKDFMAVVRNGSPKGMPGFPAKFLSDTQVAEIYASLESNRSDCMAANQDTDEKVAILEKTDTFVAEPPSEVCSIEGTNEAEKLRILTNFNYKNVLAQFFPNPLLSSQRLSTLLDQLPEDELSSRFATAKDELTFQAMSANAEVAIEVGHQLATNKAYQDAFFAMNGMSCDLQNADTACVAELNDKVFARMWRRPLDSDEKKELRGYYSKQSSKNGLSKEDALGSLVSIVISSPNFWFFTEDQGNQNEKSNYLLTSYEVANRLAIFTTGQLPDDKLWSAAIDQSIMKPAKLASEYDRLIETKEAAILLQNFANQWMNLNYIYKPDHTNLSASQNLDLYQGGKAEFSELFAALVQEKNTFEELYTTNQVIVKNDVMSSIYDMSLGRGQTTDPNRSGILTRIGYLMAQHENPSAILRGVSLRRNVLCDVINEPPPSAPTTIDPVEGKDFTSSREALETATSDASCAGCHDQINPLGLALGNFDGTGSFRTHEQVFDSKSMQSIKIAIDTKVVPRIDFADTLSVTKGPLDFLKTLSKSKKAKLCLASKLFQSGNGALNSSKSCGQLAIGKALMEGKSIRDAIKQYVISPYFIQRPIKRNQ